MDYKEMTEREMERERILLERYRRRLAVCPPGYLQVRPHRHGLQYYHKLPGVDKPRYLNRSLTGLRNELAYKRVLQEAVERLERNLALMEPAAASWQPYSYGELTTALPKSYAHALTPLQDGMDPGLSAKIFSQSGSPPVLPSQNPFRRHELIHHTSFGLLTRSKGEAMIAELLYSAGLPVLYEQKLRLQRPGGGYVNRYPDFTFPLEEPLYLEHKGMMQDDKYARRDLRTSQLYHYNGIYPPKNLIITMDGPNGAFSVPDMEQVICGLILPRFR